MKNFRGIYLYSQPENFERISEKLWEFELEGITEEENRLIIYLSEDSFLSTEEISSFLMQSGFDISGIEEFTPEIKNWNEEWEQNLRIMKIGKKIVVRPSNKPYETDLDEIVVIIDPKMSFGTGEHQTTRLVMEILENTLVTGKKVLDYGSGTAILAITAVKLGAGDVIALDNDEWCLLNGNENVELNDVKGKIEVKLGSLADLGPDKFDLILANINRHILIENAEMMLQQIQPGGTVILSGILNDDVKDILEVFSRYSKFSSTRFDKDEWSALKLENTRIYS
ncbi:MAG: 50S ribosomal protein L11 methyltransferase [Ignavibacteriales bacterium]|nr:50S ribosomal protein L11 methyltransferase [Ignavibacteriales bacterium]MCF8435789.1 50S ribosomal protein L11 methyltransferase [Ignavibacteriales bacterium]